eukprot:SAG31_NODE_2408_length_5758_cov_10.495847_1_plen_123_part_00
MLASAIDRVAEQERDAILKLEHVLARVEEWSQRNPAKREQAVAASDTEESELAKQMEHQELLAELANCRATKEYIKCRIQHGPVSFLRTSGSSAGAAGQEDQTPLEQLEMSVANLNDLGKEL